MFGGEVGDGGGVGGEEGEGFWDMLGCDGGDVVGVENDFWGIRGVERGYGGE